MVKSSIGLSQLGPEMSFYKSEGFDLIMLEQRMLPRYATLARKAFSYYLGDMYNPETIDCEVEYLFRHFIKNYVVLKVFDKEPYDWPFIDHSFRELLCLEGFTHLTYDRDFLNKGYNGVMRGNLPVHSA